MSAMFYVGQKVVCVDDQNIHPDVRAQMVAFPVRKCVYTIRAFGDDGGILLEECVNPKGHWRDGYYEPDFHPRRFRPVRETSIECFRALLNTRPEDLTDTPAPREPAVPVLCFGG